MKEVQKHFIKQAIATLLVVLPACAIFSQEYTVGVNVDTPNPNAVLHLASPNGNQGLMIPKLTTGQRESMVLTGEEDGLMVYDETEGTFYFWKDASWTPIASTSGVWVAENRTIYFNDGNVGVGTTTPRALLQVGETLGVSSFNNASDTPDPIRGNALANNLGVDYSDAANNQLVRINDRPGSLIFMEGANMTFLRVAPGLPGSVVNLTGDVESILDLEETGNASFRGGVVVGDVLPGEEREGMLRIDEGGSNRLQVFYAGVWSDVLVDDGSGITSFLILNNPVPLAASEVLGGIVFEGVESGGFSPQVGSVIRAVSTEAWTDPDANGTALEFAVVPGSPGGLIDPGPVGVMKVEHDGFTGRVSMDGDLLFTGNMTSLPGTSSIGPISVTDMTLPPPEARVLMLEGAFGSIKDIDVNGVAPGQELIIVCQGTGSLTVQSSSGNIILNADLNYLMSPGDTLHLIFLENPLADAINRWVEIGRSDYP